MIAIDRNLNVNVHFYNEISGVFFLLFFLFKSYISIYKHKLNNAPPPEKSRQLLMEKHMVGYWSSYFHLFVPS